MQLASNSTPKPRVRSSRSPAALSTKPWRNLLEASLPQTVGIRGQWAPPPDLTVSQWADQFRRLSSEASAEPGTWRTDRAPYQRGIMDASSDPLIREVVVMKSAQVGWTEILNNTIGFHVDQDPSPTLLLQPTLEMAEAWSKDRLAPMIRDTPRLKWKIADPKARDSGNTLLHKRFTGGHLTIVGANSPAGLASRPIRVLLCDEVDRFPVSAGAEGDPIDLARRRTATFRNRKILMGSTPTVKGQSRIEAAFEQSDQRYFMVPCPHCDGFQRLVWPQVKWPEGQPELAAYCCEHCGTLLTDADKPGMLARGEWRGTKPFNGVAGFHISEIYSPWTSWPEMAQAFTRAKKFPETLQTWINTALGETWEEKGEGVESGSLLGKREPYTTSAIPQGVTLLTAGVDVQDDRLEVFVYGWGSDEEAWLLEHKVLRGDPSQEPIWLELDAYRRTGWMIEDGRRLMIEATAVDSGGHCTQSVYRYCVKRKAQRVFAIKGMAGAGRLAWPKLGKRSGASRAQVFVIGVDTIKSLIYGRLRIAEPGPGYFHFPASVDQAFFDQLTSEVQLTKVIQGRRVSYWKPKSSGIRQEALDGTVYAYAALLGRGVEVLGQRSRMPMQAIPKAPEAEAPIETVIEPAQPAPPAAARQAPRPSGFINRPKGSWFNRR
jgi:phage terminase large subunit GpA-like protein